MRPDHRLSFRCTSALLTLIACLALPAGLVAQSYFGFPDPQKRVRYDQVRDQIGVRFSKPLAAGSLADTVSKAGWADGICVAPGSHPELDYKGPVSSTATDVAHFAVKGGCSPQGLALLARAITDNVADASEAGLMIAIHPTGTLAVLTDSLLVELAPPRQKPSTCRGASATETVYQRFQLHSVDPFSPDDRFFFRLYQPACVQDLTSTQCRDHANCLRGGQCPRKDLVALLQAASDGGCFRGQPVRAVEPTLIPLTQSDEEKAFDAWLKGQENLEDNLTGTIGVSFTGNEAAGESDFKVGADIKLDLGSYPSQLRVGAGAQVQFKDNVVTEDVTKLRVSYDYYFERWLELYGFLERFTNNFLSIEQRYESGVGVLFEWDAKAGPGSELCVDVPGPVHYHRSKSGEVPKEIRVTRRAQKMLDVYRQRLRREAREKGVVSDETKKKYCRYKLGIQKRHARFQGGLAISLFGDFEQPDELSITAKPVGDPPPPKQGGPEEIEVKVRPPSAHRFRVTVRPSLTYRPNNRTELFAHYYFKAALDEPQVESDLEPSGDAGRQEFLVGAKITLAADETGGQKVALSLSAEQFHDRFPPSVTEEAALEAFGVMDPSAASLVSFMPAGADVPYTVPESALRARRTHTVYKFALSISW